MKHGGVSTATTIKRLGFQRHGSSICSPVQKPYSVYVLLRSCESGGGAKHAMKVFGMKMIIVFDLGLKLQGLPVELGGGIRLINVTGSWGYFGTTLWRILPSSLISSCLNLLVGSRTLHNQTTLENIARIAIIAFFLTLPCALSCRVTRR